MDTNTEGEGVTLTEFLLARIDEDEAVAREAIDRDRPGTHWQWVAPDDVADTDAPRWLRTVEEFQTSSGVGPLPAFPLGFEFKAESARGMDHIARHDPARVLAECGAKRRIVDEHPSTDPINHEGDRYCRRCLERGYDIGYPDEWVQAYYPCPTLRLLALPYADHADHNESWRV